MKNLILNLVATLMVGTLAYSKTVESKLPNRTKEALQVLLKDSRIHAIIVSEKKNSGVCSQPYFIEQKENKYYFNFSCIFGNGEEGEGANLYEVEITDMDWGFIVEQIKFDYAG